MAEFTKEEQIQAIYDLKVGYTLGHADIAMLKAMARQLLASMEQTPVYLRPFGDDGETFVACDGNDERAIPLYAAPQLPQPAVPDIATVETTYPDVQTNWQDAKMYAEGWNACRAAMLQGAELISQPYTLPTKCWCHTCRPVTMTDMRFVVCPDCGNKRCPHANDHRNACTGSNEPGQEGSAYPAAPHQEEANRIHEERVKIQEEMAMGARLTKHRFNP